MSLSHATVTSRNATTLTVYNTTVPQKMSAIIEQQCRMVLNHAREGDKSLISVKMMFTWYGCGGRVCNVAFSYSIHACVGVPNVWQSCRSFRTKNTCVKHAACCLGRCTCEICSGKFSLTVYLGRERGHSHDKCYQATPSILYMMQTIKNETVERPGNEEQG